MKDLHDVIYYNYHNGLCFFLLQRDYCANLQGILNLNVKENLPKMLVVITK